MNTKIYNLINKELPIVKKSKFKATSYYGACLIVDSNTGKCHIKFNKDKLRKDFKSIGVKPKKNTYTSTLLHEFGHYLDYKEDPIGFRFRGKYETEVIAWEKARLLAKKMRLTIDEESVIAALKTYEKYKDK